eukprot:scaffold92296_cov75-Phaeocystis_antarctica.AAC.1
MDTVGFSLLARRYVVAPVGCRGKAQNGSQLQRVTKTRFSSFFPMSRDSPDMHMELREDFSLFTEL